MSDKNKYKKTRSTEFIRYHRDELSGKERNSFEKELQKDPFTEEASEGLKSILPGSYDDDISDLDERLKIRTTGRRSFILFRIAASIAIVVAISSIFIIIEKNKTSKQIALNTLEPPVLEIARSKPVTQPEVKTIPQQKQILTEKRKAYNQETKALNPAAGAGEEQTKVTPVPARSEINNVSSKSAESTKKDNLSDLKSEAAVSEIAEDRISQPAGAMPGSRSLKKVDNEKVISGYVPPQPVNGKSEFDKYIKENLHRPDSLTGQRGEVILSFIVRLDGSLERIRIVSSPGKLFSDEAIRLIKAGPPWKPAEQSGQPIEDRVKVKIEFR